MTVLPLNRNILTYSQPVSLVFLSTSTTIHNRDLFVYPALTNP